jgi:hypothetical protein
MDISRRNRLQILYDGCTSTVQDLETLVNRYDSLGTHAHRTWDRIRFGLQDLFGVLSRLTSSTVLLTAFDATLMK